MDNDTDGFPEARLRELYDEHLGDNDAVLAAAQREFSWTVQQAYVATEFLFRPSWQHGGN